MAVQTNYKFLRKLIMSVIDFTRLVARESHGLDKSIDGVQLYMDLVSYHLSQYFINDKGIIYPSLGKTLERYKLTDKQFTEINDDIATYITSCLRKYGRDYKSPVKLDGLSLHIPFFTNKVSEEFTSRCDKEHRFSINNVISLISNFFAGDIRFKNHDAFTDLAFTYLSYEFSKNFIGLPTIEEHPLRTYFSREELLTILEIYRKSGRDEISDCLSMSENGLLGYVFDELDTLISSHVDDIMTNYGLNSRDVIYIYKTSPRAVGILVDRDNLESYVFKLVVDTRNGKLHTDIKNPSINFCRDYL